jgi:Kef-type K+ transport system membrane component KefB/nucleotide-binding universal stress UspA family protein
MDSSPRLVPSVELVRRVIVAAMAYILARIRVLERIPRNPSRVAYGAITLGGLAGLAISPVLAAGDASSAPSETKFIAAILVILLTSRLVGEAMQRLGQPAVIGQLIAGILLGPSLFGLIWPQMQHALLPPDAAQRAMLDGIAQFGVLLLLLVTGMDADVGLIRKVGRPAIAVSLTGIAIPFACGVVLAFFLPDALIPHAEQRLAMALFLGVALSISSIKIVAMVVHEMNFMRRDLGQIIVASAIIDDSVGWIIIAIVFGVARAGSVQIGEIAQSVGGVALFLALSLTFGRRAVAAAIRFVNDNFVSELPVVTLILIIMGAMALITAALGVQSVLGAFVAGVLIGESPILTKNIAAQLGGMITAFFAPIFFALAGLSADLTVLKSPALVALTLGLILIASIGKFAGAFLGGAIGRLSRTESLALAVGMNARGSTEVIVASIGLSIGALSQTLYTMIVTMAVLTTCAMPPTLRWALSRVPLRPGEKERLDREAFEAKGFVAKMERLLLMANDNSTGRFASRLAGLLAGSRGLPTTLLHIEHKPDSDGERSDASAKASEMTDNVKQSADVARRAQPDAASDMPAVAVKTRAERGGPEQAVSREAPKGYDLLIVGLDPARMPQGGLNPEIAKAARAYEGPSAVVVARGAHDDDPIRGRMKILAPVTGTAISKHAAEVAIELARAARADLTILYVTPAQPSPDARAQRGRRLLTRRHEEAVLREIVAVADHYELRVNTKIRIADVPSAAILDEADSAGDTLIVVGVSMRPSEALLFGNTADQLLETSQRSLLFVAS